MQPPGLGFWDRILTSEMEQPATLPLRFPSSPVDLRPSKLEWQPKYSPSPLDKSAVFGNTPTSSSSYDLPTLTKTTAFKRPNNQKRRKQPSLLDRQDSSPSSVSFDAQIIEDDLLMTLVF